jgi:hypothetical protein
VVAEHQQEGFVAHGLARAVDRVAKTFLGGLHDEGDVPPDLEQASGIFLEMRRQFVVVLDGNLLGE